MGTRAVVQAERWMSMVERIGRSANGLTAAELAAEFNCDPRTIYRDVLALERLGVPIVQDREEGAGAAVASRWKILDGWRLRAPTLEATPGDLLALGAATA